MSVRQSRCLGVFPRRAAVLAGGAAKDHVVHSARVFGDEALLMFCRGCGGVRISRSTRRGLGLRLGVRSTGDHPRRRKLPVSYQRLAGLSGSASWRRLGQRSVRGSRTGTDAFPHSALAHRRQLQAAQVVAAVCAHELERGGARERRDPASTLLPTDHLNIILERRSPSRLTAHSCWKQWLLCGASFTTLRKWRS